MARGGERSATTTVGPEGHRYRWIGDWAALDDSPSRRVAWAHHGLATTAGGDVVGFDSVDGRVLVLGADGRVRRRLDCGVVEGHGACVVVEGGIEHLWIADLGVRADHVPGSRRGYKLRGPDGARGRVLRVRLDDGAVVAELPTPDHPRYRDRPYVPTDVVVAPDGTVWVADGYGASLVHRFASDGHHLGALDGEDWPAGPFACPHGLLVDRRRQEPELVVADRENHRLVVLGLDGGFRREVAAGALARPAALATHGDLLIVAELRARVALLDVEGRVVAHLGDDEPAADSPGWPNALDGERIVRRTALEPGRFVSPHGLAVDAGGNIYVTEWLVGGRYTKLAPRS